MQDEFASCCRLARIVAQPSASRISTQSVEPLWLRQGLPDVVVVASQELSSPFAARDIRTGHGSPGAS
jgi:hypothetical protein